MEEETKEIIFTVVLSIFLSFIGLSTMFLSSLVASLDINLLFNLLSIFTMFSGIFLFVLGISLLLVGD